MRKLVRILAALVIVVAIALGGFYLAARRKLNRTFTVEDTTPVIPTDSASIERGRYLTTAITKCTECHGQNMGGKLFIDGGPLGKIYSANLTRGAGGVGDSLSPAQWVATVRHGVSRSGRALLVMPAASFNALGDDDFGAIIAYIRTLPAVDFVPQRSFLRPLGWFLYVSGQFPTLTEADLVPHSGPRPPVPPRGATVEYGKYLATIGGCNACHGPTFSGGPIPGMPPGSKPAGNLTPAGLNHYTESDFFRALRDGKRPDGTDISPQMPFNATRLMTNDDITAVFAFLKQLPPKPYGNR